MNIRHVERQSILDFMTRHRNQLRGRVLDFGAGKSPYKHLVSGEYVAFEKGDDINKVGTFDTVMCNQVLQYVDDPYITLCHIRRVLVPGGKLVMTYPANWSEIELDDLWRFTKSGMSRLLTSTGYTIIVHELRAQFVNNEDGFVFPLGYGVIAIV